MSLLFIVTFHVVAVCCGVMGLVDPRRRPLEPFDAPERASVPHSDDHRAIESPGVDGAGPAQTHLHQHLQEAGPDHPR